MSLASDSHTEAFRDSARALLAGLTSHRRLRRLRGTLPGYEKSVWTTLAEAGWTAILVPDTHGGLGLGLRELMTVAEEIGRQLLPEPFIAAGVQPVALLLSLPPSPLRDRLLADIVAGKRLAAVAWQSESGDMDGLGAAVTVGSDAAQHSLTGECAWVAPATGLDGWLVMAQDQKLLWVEPGPLVDVDPQPRVDGSFMARLRFHQAPAQRLSEGPPALAALARANDLARLTQAAELLGLATHVYEVTLAYLKTRVQFDKPIGANQALQHRMVDAYLAVELTRACLEECVTLSDQDPQKLAALASRAKARASATALQLTRLAIQFHGAIGYTDEYEIGLYWKRAVHLEAWLGNASAHRSRYLKLRQSPGLPAPAAPDLPELPADTDWATLPDEHFRLAIRGFLQKHYPDRWRHAPRRLHWHEIKEWYFALSRQGWIAPAWPKSYGGMELPPDKLLMLIEEFEDYGVSRLPDQGLINLGPVIIQHGSAAQKAYWLPRILSGEHIWCQGYSEPNAGSDLASLRTEAIADGDHFVVNGQKIWTTLAQDATHIFLLVRTDKRAKKQRGISFLLADLKTPGITVRPITNIAGDQEFCEVFLDNVRVPQENLVGALNEGWTIAKALLGFERLFVGSPKTCRHALGLLEKLAERMSLFDDRAFEASFAAHALDLADLEALYSRYADMVRRGETLPPSVSLLKIWATETYTRIGASLVDAAAEHAGDRIELQIQGDSIDPLAPLFAATYTTIYGGSNEIQRNILARQVLELPV